MDDLVTVRDCLVRTVPDRDHRGMGQAPPWRHGSHYDHTAKGGRSTTGSQTASSRTLCPSCVHAPQERQQ